MNHLAGFANELRRQCGRYETIAQVCEGAGINRQQFNKYLSGQVLPSARSLAKICAFLQVSEQTMLGTMPPVPNSVSSNDRRKEQSPHVALPGSDEFILALAAQRLSSMTKQNVKSGSGLVREGHYACYFPLHTSSDLLLRVLVTVRSRCGILGFSRRTYFPTSNSRRHYVARGKHNGLVLSGPTDIYLIAVNSRAPWQLSYTVVSEAPVGTAGYYSGLAITRTTRSQFASTIVLKHIGEVSSPASCCDN